MTIRWVLVLLLCWPAPLWAGNFVSLDFDLDGKTETIALEAQSLSVQSSGRESSVALEQAALAVESVPLAPRLILVAVTYRLKGSRCYWFYRYRSRRLEVVPVEVDDDEFADNRICASGNTQVRWADLNADGTAELVVEEYLKTSKSVRRRRVYQYLDGSFGTVPLLSGLLVDGVPVLAQLSGTYYKPEAIAAIDSLQELSGLRTSPALTIGIQGPLPGYQLGLKTPAGETSVTLITAQRSVDLRRGEQVLTFSVLATGRNGRIIYDSAADLTGPPLVVVGLGRELDGIYRPAPYDPKWPSFEAYLTQGVLVGTWVAVGSERELLRIEPGGATNAVTLFAHSYAIDLKAGLGSPFDFALLGEAGVLLVDLRGTGTLAIAPGRCAQEAARGNVCTATGAPILYRRREEIGIRP